ncbi:uncharacterized protein LOC143624310 [Bidens hawaiensis]|uniref:uncharacterized protein LOC143624310 n=1 Tax=Bidens hawaiensis TaxID=980011 RepID=UPI004049C829
MSESDGDLNHDALTLQIANILKNSLGSQTQSTKQTLSDSLKISINLNSQNYTLWARMIQVAIGGKSKALLNHLTTNPPEPTNEKYDQWEQDDLVVFSWLIQNIEPAIASNLTEFRTSKSLWDALVITYSSGKDKFQTFDLHVKANELKQNGIPLEEFWIVMQGIWGEIERTDPNPMTCAADITTYNKIRAKQKLFQFLNALDRKYDPIKREILRCEPLPSAEEAYAAVRKEYAHQNILGGKSSDTQGVATGLMASDQTTEGLGLVLKGQRRSDQGWKPAGSSSHVDKSRSRCSHCRMSKHTKEQCFKLVGFPGWWIDGHKKGDKDKAKAATTVGNSEVTNNGGGDQRSGGDRSGAFGGIASATQSSAATEHTDCNERGNGFEGANPLICNISFINPTVRKVLNWPLEKTDIRTGTIIGRGTERQGLYYVEEVTQHGSALLAHGTTNREALLWHRRPGHPSIGALSLSTYQKSTEINLTHVLKNAYLWAMESTKKGIGVIVQQNIIFYTTMNCDFLETKFFYSSQLSGEGEKEHDTLSWLEWVPKWTSSSEEVNHSTQDESPNPQQSSEPINSATIPNAPDLTSDVSNSQSFESITNEGFHVGHENIDISNNHEIEVEQTVQKEQEEPLQEEIRQEETTKRYVLPPRVNRGIPAKRYSPEKQPKSSRYPMANIVEGNLSIEAKAFTSSLYTEQIPTSVEQGLKSKNWTDAMDTEMKALMKNNTWEKCDLPTGKKPVGCRWVFSIKHKPDGTIERYKARLVAKGYTQTYGVDYSETFSPVAKFDTIQGLFSIAANEGWPLHQFDVKNAFLHGELEEEVYMEAPPGFIKNFKTKEVCRLKKSLYGLKQSPRAWFGGFTLAMRKYGYQQGNSDHTLFIKRQGNDEEEMKKLKENLFTEFEMKDLGRLKYFLGIEVLRSKRGIFICQKKYILDLLAQTGMVDCKPVDTPITLELLAGNGRPWSSVSAKQDLKVQLYTDADWVGDQNDRKSTSRYFTLVGGNLVTWRSKKQKVVALSSAEAEFQGIARGLAEVLWIHKLLTEIGFPLTEASKIMCDNKAAIQISENPVQYDCTKHIEIDQNIIKEKLEAGTIELPFVRSEDQLADILTKTVNGRVFSHCLSKLSIGNPTTQLEGEC